jgi:hypothetical protein
MHIFNCGQTEAKHGNADEWLRVHVQTDWKGKGQGAPCFLVLEIKSADRLADRLMQVLLLVTLQTDSQA